MPVENKAGTSETTDRELTLTRVFDAPRALVFKAWTEKQHLARWCAPHGFVVTEAEGDLLPGGAWRSTMRSPEGVDHRVVGFYREIVPPERLVFTHRWLDDQGKPGHDTLVTITLTEENGKTRMHFHQAIFKSVESRDGHQGGWTQAFERLGEYLATL